MVSGSHPLDDSNYRQRRLQERGLNSGSNPLDDSNHRQRRRQERGIDVPPSISGPSSDTAYGTTKWKPLDWETHPLHRLCTLSTDMEGTSICAPLIVFQRFIASVSADTGCLKLYELSADWARQSPLTQVQPKWKCHVNITTDSQKEESLRVVAISSVEVSLEEYLLGFMVLVTCEGDVYICKLFSDKDPRTVHSFSTRVLNVMSVACWMEGDILHIGIGTKAGLVEEWKINTEQQESRIWRGSFKTPLHSLVAVPMEKKTHTLSACISERPRMGRALQSSTVEVLDRMKIQKDWKEDSEALLLSNYCQWPDAGREWRRSADTGIEGITFGSNELHRLGDSSWGAALADGSVGILTSFKSEREGGGWGVMPYARQATLAYPAIGLGELNLPSGPHLACCLRGGTVYCLSMDYDEEDESAIPIFLPPFEGGEEDYEFLHGFAAGNIQMQGSGVTYGSLHTDKLPIVVYSGDGGVMEVFACGSLCSMNPSVEKHVALQEMTENGTIRMLVDELQGMSDENSLLTDILWLKSRQECRDEAITVDMVMANHKNRFENTHALLLSLAAA